MTHLKSRLCVCACRCWNACPYAQSQTSVCDRAGSIVHALIQVAQRGRWHARAFARALACVSASARARARAHRQAHVRAYAHWWCLQAPGISNSCACAHGNGAFLFVRDWLDARERARLSACERARTSMCARARTRACVRTSCACVKRVDACARGCMCVCARAWAQHAAVACVRRSAPRAPRGRCRARASPRQHATEARPAKQRARFDTCEQTNNLT
eukprot:3672174-Pleurochrysis_carterae.AAC.2